MCEIMTNRLIVCRDNVEIELLDNSACCCTCNFNIGRDYYTHGYDELLYHMMKHVENGVDIDYISFVYVNRLLSTHCNKIALLEGDDYYRFYGFEQNVSGSD